MSSKKKTPGASAKTGSAAAKKPASASSRATSGNKGGTQHKMSPVKGPVAKPKRTGLMIGIAVGAIAIIALVTLTGGGGTGTSGGGWGKPTANAAEAKYIGRLLPAGYAEPKVADAFAYSASTPMTQIDVKDDGTGISLALADVTSKRNVLFEYARPGGKPLPMIAYVKPSGSLFVAVSFCPPCEGERQRIEPDSTLTCESCGTKRDLETSVGLSGPCKLYPLDEVPVKVAGDRIVLEKAVLDGWTAQPKDRPIGG